jgi:quercetin dioxygenase-like cupin family protein
MIVRGYQQVEREPVKMDGATGVHVRWLIGDREGARNFAMRHFEIEPGGHTPRHHHPYEHEVYILDGEGVVLEGETEHPFRAGDSIYVPADEVHQFQNTGDRPVRFLCMIPSQNKCTR